MKGGADALDMDTLGYFLYMDSVEKQQKEASPDLFGDSSDEDEDDEDE